MLPAIWVFDWLLGMIEGSLPSTVFSAKKYPKTFAWLGRYRDAWEAAKKKLGDRPTIDGAEAHKRIMSAGYGEQDGDLDEEDFTDLEKGASVEAWPVDDYSGKQTREAGEVVTLTHEEVVLQKKIPDAQAEIRVHLPRWNYHVQAATHHAQQIEAEYTTL